MFFHAHSLRLLYSMPIQNQFAKPPLRGFSFAPNKNKKSSILSATGRSFIARLLTTSYNIPSYAFPVTEGHPSRLTFPYII